MAGALKGFPDFQVVREELQRDNPPEDGGAKALAEAGWYAADLPAGLTGLPHPADVLSEPPTPAEHPARVAAEMSPEDPQDRALLTPERMIAALVGVRRKPRKVPNGPSDYQAFVRLLPVVGPVDYEDEFYFGPRQCDPLHTPHLEPGLPAVVMNHGGQGRASWPIWVVTSRGGTTDVEVSETWVARGMGQFLVWLEKRGPAAAHPKSVPREHLTDLNPALTAWLDRCAPGSRFVDLRSAELPVTIPPRTQSSFGRVYLCGAPRIANPHAADMLRRIAQLGSVRAAADDLGLHPVALVRRLRACPTYQNIVQSTPRTDEAEREWSMAKSRAELPSGTGRTTVVPPPPDPLDEYAELTPEFVRDAESPQGLMAAEAKRSFWY